MSRSIRDAKILSRVTLISSFGDFLTYFTVVKILYEIYGNAFSAAFGGIGLGSAAGMCAGLAGPFLKRYVNTKNLIVSSLVFSALAVALLLLFIEDRLRFGALPFLVLLFLQTFCARVYEFSRETHTHGHSVVGEDHRMIQAILLGGVYSAQFLGPLTAFVLLRFFPLQLPLGLDLLTYFIAICLSLNLNRGVKLDRSLNALKSFSHLSLNPKLRTLFFLRTIGFWVPASIFNMVIYENAVTRLGVGVEYSGVIYSVLGFGALVGSLLLQGKVRILTFRSFEVNQVASLAQVGFALSIALMFLSDNLVWGTFCYLTYGVCMGINAASTQAMRRQLCSVDQLSEVMGFEVLVSLGLQFGLTFLISRYFPTFGAPLMTGLLIASALYLCTAWLFKNFHIERKVDH